MEFYKNERVFTKIGFRYSGLKISAGDEGKIVSIRPNLVSILWDKDRRQLARLTPPNDILKTKEISYNEFKKKASFEKIIQNEEMAIEAELNKEARLPGEYVDFRDTEGGAVADRITEREKQLTTAMDSPIKDKNSILQLYNSIKKWNKKLKIQNPLYVESELFRNAETYLKGEGLIS